MSTDSRAFLKSKVTEWPVVSMSECEFPHVGQWITGYGSAWKQNDEEEEEEEEGISLEKQSSRLVRTGGGQNITASEYSFSFSFQDTFVFKLIVK